MDEEALDTMNNTSQESITSSLSEDNINEILEDNGLSEVDFNEDVTADMEDEDSEESYDENQGEGNDDLESGWEAALEETREDFNQALDEAAETTAVSASAIGTSTTEPPSEPSQQEVKKIPLNSPTLLIDESTSRFSGAEWFNEIQKQRIIIAGIGGIGSNAAFQIARMVPANITMYDDDNVEIVNMAGQLYSYLDVGKAKVNAMADMITSYTTMRNINAINDKFTPTTEAGDIMICGFDNMRARTIFFDSWCHHMADMPDEDRAKCLFLDGRLSMDTLQIFCIKGDDIYNILRYKKEFLFKDSEADATVCSMKQTTYLACMIGSLMTNLFTNFVANTLNPIIPYDLPFFTEYDAQNMIFKTES